ncbi:MAG: cytochrome C oxidase subunit IV family protein [Polyangiaceae bacterium]
MADDDKNPSVPDDEDEEVKTSVETIDAKRAEAERQKATSQPPEASKGEDDEADEDESDDDAPSDDGSAEDEDEDDARDEAPASEPPKKVAAPPAAKAPAHGHGHGGEHHGFAHVTSVKLLVGVLAVLMVLTIATVAVTSIDLGSQYNLVVAMVIATIKAGLVVTFFMHLLWDKKFHLLVFLSSVLFLILFLGLAITDRKEYQSNITNKEADVAAAQSAQ